MVALLPESQIEGFYMDTVEKALFFGSLMLRAAIISSDNENTEDLHVAINVIASGETSADLSLEVNLPYDAYRYNLSGGSLLDNIGELTTISATVGDDVTFTSVPTNSGLIIPDYDEIVINTFEKYLLYYSQILWASVANKRSSTIELTFLGNQENAQVLISASLPINLDSWLLGGNYLNALGSVVDSYNAPLLGGGQSSGEDDAAVYSVSYAALEPYYIEEFLVVTSPGILESITIEADYFSDIGAVSTSWYLNGVGFYPDEVIDFGDGTYSLIFDTASNPIILASGDVLGFELYEEPAPSFMNIDTYILEFSN